MESTPIRITQFLSQIANLDTPIIEKIINELQSLIKRRNERDPQKKELKLLEKLNQTIFPEEQLNRYLELGHLRYERELNKDEEVEFSSLLEDEQKLTLERIHILGELAQLKDISVEELIIELELQPAESV